MDSTIVTALVNTGVAGIVVVLMIFGFLVPKPTVARLEQENASLRASRDTERQRANEAVDAGRVTTQLIGAIAGLAAARGHEPGWQQVLNLDGTPTRPAKPAATPEER